MCVCVAEIINLLSILFTNINWGRGGANKYDRDIKLLQVEALAEELKI